MYTVVTSKSNPDFKNHLDEMHRHRKSLFVDTLKWSVPIVDGIYEIDQFDSESAVYILVLDDASRRHLGSVRLLPSTKPHLLDSIFPDLVAGAVPRGGDIYEITRLCAAPRLGAAARLEVRNAIATALVEFGLLYGIRRYTCIAEMSWLSQILAMGWECEPLGPNRVHDGAHLGALAIDIIPATLQLFWAQRGRRRTLIEIEPLREAA